MFYASFRSPIGRNEIAFFNTEEERNAWVNFQDPFSAMDKEAKDFMFPRRALSTEYARRRIRRALHKKIVHDTFNDNQNWWILGGVA